MQGATEAPMEPELITSKFGFVENAEIVNSRAAMVSIPLLLLQGRQPVA